MEKAYSITALNERSALVLFGNIIDKSVNEKVISLYHLLNNKSFNGFVESVPAYSSLAVFYDPNEVIRTNFNSKSAFEVVKECLEDTLLHLPHYDLNDNIKIVDIPVLYNGEDLEFVADQHGLTNDQVIDIHVARNYRVFMLGFLPGFPYLGVLDHRIATPRRSSPRTFVPSGSVGIAGLQTGIYPQASPGGWQLIGRTPIKIFNKEIPNPCLVNPGDYVRFYSIGHDEFERLNEY